MKATIFGSRGLLGRALLKTSSCDVFEHRREHGDLTTPISSFSTYNDLWINAAAKVGGVKGNTDFVGEFYRDNIDIANNVLEAARANGVKKLVSILSTCIYPDAQYVDYPITEEQLHNGPPHPSNYGYAYAKRMLDVGSRAYRQQWGCNFITVVPNNLYGPHDNYDINNGHVIPSLIRKFYEAHLAGTDVTVWGSGKPLREFTFSEDAAKIIWWCAENYNDSDPVNIGNTEEVPIGDVAREIGRIMGFKGQIKFDTSKPEGQFRKPTSNKKLRDLGCEIQYTPLSVGLESSIDFFVKNYPNVRGI